MPIPSQLPTTPFPRTPDLTFPSTLIEKPNWNREARQQHHIWTFRYHLYHITLMVPLLLLPLQIWHIQVEYLSYSPSWGDKWPLGFRSWWRSARFDTAGQTKWAAVFLGVSVPPYDSAPLVSLLALSHYHYLLHQGVTSFPVHVILDCDLPLKYPHLQPWSRFALHTLYDIAILNLILAFTTTSLLSLQKDRILCRKMNYEKACDILVSELSNVIAISVVFWGLLGLAHIALLALRIWEQLASPRIDPTDNENGEADEIEKGQEGPGALQSTSVVTATACSQSASTPEPIHVVPARRVKLSSSTTAPLPPHIVAKGQYHCNSWPTSRKEGDIWRDVLLGSLIP
ncbi:hypothetical protein GQ43DRAFT_476567 [Delitschia confertaspora ATCC 74209]|uniref:Uncharacterized protein n=1 Tax=Delitschia confertaspora ATCC 74209 TaxID=1513339 RepID=A0A9P4JGB7_9PLEO|nr:hypothetical protein GQ43DRAFT_476567 [Delitschia confertaspora ATCC 74209]